MVQQVCGLVQAPLLECVNNVLQFLEGEEIGPEGVENFCYDLGVEPEDVRLHPP